MVANQGGHEKGGVDGSIGARAPVTREGSPLLCRRGKLKGRWWFGSGPWGGSLRAGSGAITSGFVAVGERRKSRRRSEYAGG